MEDLDPKCLGCHQTIEEGSVVAFGDGIWHIECFRCAKCNSQIDCDGNLMLLSDGQPICEKCSYSCRSCGQAIEDEAIMTGDDAYHAECFCCISCNRRIEDLVFTQSTKGIYCMPCYELRKEQKMRRKEEKLRSRKREEYSGEKTLPAIPRGNNIASLGSTNLSDIRPPMRQQLSTDSTSTHRLSSDSLENPRRPPPRPETAPSLNLNEKRSRRSPMEPRQADKWANASGDFRGTLQKGLPNSTEQQSDGQLFWENSNSRSSSPFSANPTSGEQQYIDDVPIHLQFLDKNQGYSVHFEDESPGLLPHLSSEHNQNLDQPKFPMRFSFEAHSRTFDRLSKMLEHPEKEGVKVEFSSSVAMDEKSLDQWVDRSNDAIAKSSNDKISVLLLENKLLRQELENTRQNYEKIKEVSRKAVEEFQCAKEEFMQEVARRQEADLNIQRLQSELEAVYEGKSEHGRENENIQDDINRLSSVRNDLERSIEGLRQQRDALMQDMELLVEQQPKPANSEQNRELDRMREAYQIEIESLKRDRDYIKDEMERWRNSHEDITHELQQLKQSFEELTTINRNLLSQIEDSEQQSQQLQSQQGDSQIYLLKSLDSQSQPTDALRDVRFRENLVRPRVQAPKKFTWRKAMKVMTKPRSPQPPLQQNEQPQDGQQQHLQSQSTVTHGQHQFQAASLLRPIKCEVCGETLWGLGVLKCSGCFLQIHAKCIDKTPVTCNVVRHANGDGGRGAAASGKLPIFGRDLNLQLEIEGSNIPLVLKRCIEAVETRGMDFEGIYRKSGSTSTIQSLQAIFDSGDDINLGDSDYDICAITSLLKSYLRQLPNPLVTYELYPKFISAIDIADEGEKFSTIKSLIDQLPIGNYSTLRYLVLHLDRVKNHMDINLMNPKNLAVVFGPTLLRDTDVTRDLTDMRQRNTLVEYLINNANSLFAPSSPSSQDSFVSAQDVMAGKTGGVGAEKRDNEAHGNQPRQAGGGNQQQQQQVTQPQPPPRRIRTPRNETFI
ncbi:uncharacterized protein VTP21DRAFT_9430 [Calcarisporiella thermophila]|uniref:uncharacterized protein n=1 Tax=Calcarisporiella thermophila TaxID=911321 RepID=UPI00374319BF